MKDMHDARWYSKWENDEIVVQMSVIRSSTNYAESCPIVMIAIESNDARILRP